MKKLSNFSQNQDWARDSNNYVAKSYMDTSVSKEIYFEDVKLQMDAKLWGEEFNRHNPPKKIDIFMMSVLEMTERWFSVGICKYKPDYKSHDQL